MPSNESARVRFPVITCMLRRCGAGLLLSPSRQSRTLPIAPMLLVGMMALVSCSDYADPVSGEGSVLENPHLPPVILASGGGCPPPIQADLPSCRSVDQAETAATTSALYDPAVFQTEHSLCVAMRTEFEGHLEADRVYVADWQELAALNPPSLGGRHYQIGPTSHIVLSDLNFLEMSGDDPYRRNRVNSAIHEASHALGYVDNPAEGPSAYDIGEFCSEETLPDPWEEEQEVTPGPNDGDCGAEDCECWTLVALFRWTPQTGWVQISSPWWINTC